MAAGLLAAALAAAAPAAPAPKAELAAPGDVRLLDGPFRRAMLLNADYLLSIDPDRLLHNTRKYAGLEPKGALYGGWESEGIAGHTLGHYLSAISRQYAATGDARFKARIDAIVSEMALCQKAYGDGYIGALPPLELQTLRAFKRGVVEPSGPHNFKGGAWVPWYTEHKVLNGLKDAWTLGGNIQARDVALRLADWMDDLTAGLSQDQMQLMLSVEHGGMIDAMAQLYELTGNPRYLAAARRFYHKAVLDPLLAGSDELPGKHANTQIPKIIGEATLHEATGEDEGRVIAETFWHLVVGHHSYANGGNSDDEYFFNEQETLMHVDAATAETCNTHNMLKLTEHLMQWEPRPELADYYERALYNHILASQDPDSGMFTYFLSLEPGLFKTFSTPFNSFWCCVGTGMENHTRYGAAIYLKSSDALYVNLFIPSELSNGPAGLGIRMETDYPGNGRVRLTVTHASSDPVAVRVRCPSWAASTVPLSLNGGAAHLHGIPGTYAEVRRAWSKGDTLDVSVPLGIRVEPLPGFPKIVAFLYGPALLGGDLGPAPEDPDVRHVANHWVNLKAPAVDCPALVPGTAPLASCVERVPGPDLEFRTCLLKHPAGLRLIPLWLLNTRRYSVYWRVMSDEEWAVRETPEVINH